MESFASDRSSGIMEYEFSHPIKRSQVFLAKLYTDGSLLFVGMLMSALGCLLGCQLYDDALYMPSFAAVNGLLYLYLIFLATTMIYISLYIRQVAAVAGAGFLFYIATRAFAAIPTIGSYSPGGLFSAAISMASSKAPVGVEWSIGISFGLMALCIWLSVSKLKNLDL